MNPQHAAVACTCLEGAETGAMTFPQIVDALTQAGFDGYLVDFRRAAAIYYLADGDSIELAMPSPGEVAARFDGEAIRAGIREAQQLAPGYTYPGFCRKAAAAGCAGYLTSLSGRRVLYFGRTGETHIEHMPG